MEKLADTTCVWRLENSVVSWFLVCTSLYAMQKANDKHVIECVNWSRNHWRFTVLQLMLLLLLLLLQSVQKLESTRSKGGQEEGNYHMITLLWMVKSNFPFVLCVFIEYVILITKANQVDIRLIHLHHITTHSNSFFSFFLFPFLSLYFF